MIRIKLKSDDQGQVIELPSGEYRVGSGEDCELFLEDPSLLAKHAIITVDGQETYVRRADLEGYLAIDGLEVEESSWEKGQSATIGGLEFLLVAALPDESSGKRMRAKPRSSANVHPAGAELDAHDPALECSVCKASTPESQCTIHILQGDMHYFCPHCGGKCVEPGATSAFSQTGSKSEAEVVSHRKHDTFKSWLNASLVYPFTSVEGAVILVTGVIFMLIMMVVLFTIQFAGLFGLAAFLIIFFSMGGYFIEFLKSTLLYAAQGMDRLEWPAFDDVGGMVMNVIKTFFLSVLCFLPSILWAFLLPESMAGFKVAGTFILNAVGLIIFPMGFLAFTLCESFGVLNPAFIIPSILRVKGDYFLVWLLAVVGNILQQSLNWVVGTFMHELFASIIGIFAGLYFYVILLRALGYLYFYNQKRLGWD